jgi:choline/glycine/proline betaine transport protein
VPSLICILWFTIFALAGLDLYSNEPEILFNTLKQAPYKSLFLVINQTYFPILLSFLALVCIFIFYITSSDSGSYVVDMIASGGKKAPNNYLKVYWSCVEGLLAGVLLYFGGTIFIKNLVILFSLPIIFYICFGVYKLDKMLKD